MLGLFYSCSCSDIGVLEQGFLGGQRPSGALGIPPREGLVMDMETRALPGLPSLLDTTVAMWTTQRRRRRRTHHPQRHHLVATAVLPLLPPPIQTQQHQFVLLLITSRVGEEDAWKWLCGLSV